MQKLNVVYIAAVDSILQLGKQLAKQHFRSVVQHLFAVTLQNFVILTTIQRKITHQEF